MVLVVLLLLLLLLLPLLLLLGGPPLALGEPFPFFFPPPMAKAPAAGRREVGVAAGDGGVEGRETGQTDPEGHPVTLLGVPVAGKAALTVFRPPKGRAVQDGRRPVNEPPLASRWRAERPQNGGPGPTGDGGVAGTPLGAAEPPQTG